MSKVYTDSIEKRTGGAAITVPASGQWIDLASAAQGDVSISQWYQLCTISSWHSWSSIYRQQVQVLIQHGLLPGVQMFHNLVFTCRLI